MAAQMASDDNLKTGGAALADSSIGRVYCSLTVRRRASTPTRPARPPKRRTQNYAFNLGRNPVVRKTGALLASVIVFVVGQSQERRICGHTNVRITRLSLGMIAAPAARNLKFPVKFPVSRELCAAYSRRCNLLF
jgi:hypothetical protein